MERCIEFDMLAIEVTRRCNMSCAHCLRGDTENLDMQFRYVETLLGSVKGIGELVFTGGEPTLNLGIIRDVLSYVEANHVRVDDFYLVTNGKEVTEEFLTLMLRWHAYCVSCGSGDSCGVALSRDMFHAPIPERNRRLLSGLSFFRPKDKDTDFTRFSMVDGGRAKNLNGYDKRPVPSDDLYVEGYSGTLHADGEIYLSCEGDIIAGCDYSYDEMPEHAVGNARDMDAFLGFLRGKALESLWRDYPDCKDPDLKEIRSTVHGLWDRGAISGILPEELGDTILDIHEKFRGKYRDDDPDKLDRSAEAIKFAKKELAKDLWERFGDIPMDPETEEIETGWNGFPEGTFREDIWHWFEETFDVSVAEDLMFPD